MNGNVLFEVCMNKLLNTDFFSSIINVYELNMFHYEVLSYTDTSSDTVNFHTK